MSRPKLAIARPSAAAASRTSPLSRAAARAEQGEARLVVDVSKDEHQAIKVRALQLGKSIKQYVRDLLHKDGVL